MAKRLPDSASIIFKAGAYFWATIQAHKVMRAYKEKEFKNHPSVASMLTHHLFEHRVPISLHESLAAKVEVLSKQMSETKQLADRVISEVKKKK